MRWMIAALIPLFTVACEQVNGFALAPQWQSEVVAQWQDELPDMLLLSQDYQTLFVSCETRTNMLSPSLVRIDLESGTKETLLYGLNRADGLKMDLHGNIWLGEEVEDGLIIHISSPANMPPEQRFDRDRLIGSLANVTSILAAGRFSHEGMIFSKDGQYLYLADEWQEGCLYRFEIKTNKLQVLHSQKGWLAITTPENARLRAEVLHGQYFDRMEDMELLPDGTILVAETASSNEQGRIWRLDDRGEKPQISLYLKSETITHPDNLDWDEKRQWLWITDDSSTSKLLAWDGKTVTQIATHSSGEITGVENSSDGSLYINIQHDIFGPDLTLKIEPVQGQ